MSRRSSLSRRRWKRNLDDGRLRGSAEQREPSHGLRAAFTAAFAILAVGFWLQVVQHERTARWPTTTICDFIRCAPRGVVRSQRQRVGREHACIPSRFSASDAKNMTSIRRTPCDWCRRAGIRDAVQRRRREPVFRPPPVTSTRRSQVAAAPRGVRNAQAGAAGPGARTDSHGRPFVWLRRRSRKRAAAVGVLGRNPEPRRQAGPEKVYNSKLMGTDGTASSNSSGREMDKLMEEPPVEGAARSPPSTRRRPRRGRFSRELDSRAPPP